MLYKLCTRVPPTTHQHVPLSLPLCRSPTSSTSHRYLPLPLPLATHPPLPPLPPGVESGSKLRMRGSGNAGRRGGPPGDLFVTVKVKDHPRGLRRSGGTVYSDLELDVVQAMRGCSRTVETVHGDVDLKIKAGTQPGDVLRLGGYGSAQIGRPVDKLGDHQVGW